MRSITMDAEISTYIQEENILQSAKDLRVDSTYSRTETKRHSGFTDRKVNTLERLSQRPSLNENREKRSGVKEWPYSSCVQAGKQAQ